MEYTKGDVIKTFYQVREYIDKGETYASLELTTDCNNPLVVVVSPNLPPETAHIMSNSLNACYEINPEHPEKVAGQIGELVRALETIRSMTPDTIIYAIASQVLTRIKEVG